MKRPSYSNLICLAAGLCSLSIGLARGDGSSGGIPPELGGDETCDSFIASLPANFVHGFVTVPEDWDHPEGRKIRVFYYGRKESTEPHTPVAFFNGGPSASSHSSFGLLEGGLDSGKIPFVYIDQRGNGCSDPYPSEPTVETAERLSHYGSRSIVKDAEQVRKQLFGENSKWRIFGQSYGSLIVHRYLAIAPESVEAAYAHGYAVMSDPAEWIKLRILSQKRVADDYFAKYPDDRDRLLKIRQKVAPDQCYEIDGTQICGPELLDSLTSALGFQSSWEDMNWWLNAILDTPDNFNEMMFAFSRMYFSNFTHSHFANTAINRVEIGDGLSDRDLCAQAHRELRESGENPDSPDSWPINECRILSKVRNPQLDPLVESIQVTDPLLLEEIRESLENHPQLRLYLYSSQKDVFVPVETFAEERKALGHRVEYVNFENSGHEGFHSEPRIWQDLLN